MFNSRLALRLRRWQPFSGLRAQQVSVRSHLPWHWRLLLMVIIAVLAILFGGKIYDEIRRTTGWGGGATPQEAAALRERITQLQEEVNKVQRMTATGELVDKAASQQLLAQLSALERENTQLKEEITIFEQLGKGGNQTAPLTITRLKVTPAAEGYRYEFFVAQRNDKREGEFKGNLQILVRLNPQSGGGSANMILLPRSDDADAANYAVAFKYFEKVSGVFELPEGAVPRSVEVRLLQGKAVRAVKSVNL